MDRLSPFARIERTPVSQLSDAFGRQITYLRLSVTDRCNLRCHYCMRDEVKFLPKPDVLSIEEMERLCDAFIRLGIRKLRLTGGEPLVRHGAMTLIERLGTRVASGELDELTLTTNGTLLARHATALAAAGVRRVNVSLDTLDEVTFRHITHRDGLPEVLAGIDAARAAGLSVRINTVALAGINDSEFDKLIHWCGEHGCDMAMIEMMPLGGLGAEQYLPLDLVRWNLSHRWTLIPTETKTGGPCRYWSVAETGRQVGFITPMSHGFCGACNRVRVTCTGRLVPCMAQQGGVDLRGALRGSEADDRLEAQILAAINAKPAGHSFAVGATAGDAQRMWQLGG